MKWFIVIIGDTTGGDVLHLNGKWSTDSMCFAFFLKKPLKLIVQYIGVY